jgi:HK97 family phage prohead protease
VIRKSFEAVETKVVDAARGLVDCVFSVTKNVDRQNDEIDPGAFGKAIAAKASVPVVYAHVWDDINQVLGKTVGWKELYPGDPGLPESLQAKGLGGVKTTVQFDQETPAGRVAFTHVKNRNIKDWSFAFDIDDDGEKFESDVRHIKSIKEIYEVTLALIGANPATTTMAFKAMVEAEALQPDDDEAVIVEVVKALIPLLAD